jgi:group I intron endonuclease
MNSSEKDIQTLFPNPPLELEKTSGIYCLHNTLNNKFYIGSTKNIQKRKKAHFYDLKKGKHSNDYLQAAYNLSPNAFEYVVLKVCENYIEEEQKLLDLFYDGQKKCYNLSASSEKIEHCDETKNKISRALTKRWQDPEFRKKGLARLEELFPSEKRKEQGAAGSKKQQENPNFRKNQGEHAKNTWKNKTEQEKENWLLLMKNGCATKESRDKLSKTLIEKWKNPEYKARLSKSLKGKSAKTYDVWLLDPNNNEIFLGKNLTEFCNLYKIHRKNFQKMILNQRKYMDGWRLKENAERVFEIVNKTGVTEKVSLKNFDAFRVFCKSYNIKNIGYFANFLFDDSIETLCGWNKINSK